MLNNLSAKVFCLVLGINSFLTATELLNPSQFGLKIVSKFLKYSGASPDKHL